MQIGLLFGVVGTGKGADALETCLTRLSAALTISMG